MKSIERILFATMGSLCLLGTASAAEMAGADLAKLVSGKTLYLELTSDSIAATPGQAVHYYAADGTVLFKTAKGDIWHGKWAVKDNTLCVDWKEAPNNACSRYDKQGDTINVVNVATGKTRSKVIKTADGNAEKLAP